MAELRHKRLFVVVGEGDLYRRKDTWTLAAVLGVWTSVHEANRQIEQLTKDDDGESVYSIHYVDSDGCWNICR